LLSLDEVTVHELSLADARRIAVRAQLLDRARPDGLLDAVRRLTLLQVDPVSAIAPNADLVSWSRCGRPRRSEPARTHTMSPADRVPQCVSPGHEHRPAALRAAFS
jgi:uncharacterized protein YcaQ